MASKRTCWLAETGEWNSIPDREQLHLTKDEAMTCLNEWRDDHGDEGRYYSVTRMTAEVASEPSSNGSNSEENDEE